MSALQPPDTKHGVETKFHVSQAGEWALFQSVHEPNHYIAVFPDGYLRPAKDSIRGPNAHFGVQLIVSIYLNYFFIFSNLSVAVFCAF